MTSARTKQRVRSTRPRQATSKLFIRIALDAGYIGPGKIALLEQIDKLGSIAAAGKQMHMSYKRAWYLLEEINGLCRMAVVSKTQGGPSGGGAVLTETGRELVTRYRRIQQLAAEAAGAEISAMRKLGH